MNLLKELQKEKKKSTKRLLEDDVKKEVEQFLLNAHEEDEKILHNIGLDHNIEYERQLTEDYNRTKKASEIYKQESFTGTQIKSLCNTYDLKMLRAQYYNGSIPADLTRKLKEFEETTGTNLVDSDNFFILAPVEQFQTIKHVPRAKDPILFYRSDTSTNRYGEAAESDIFIQVHNWGNDFTFLRQFRDMFNTYDHHVGDIPTNRTGFWVATFLYSLSLLFTIMNDFIFMTGFFTLIYSYLLFHLNTNLEYHNLWNTQKV